MDSRTCVSYYVMAVDQYVMYFELGWEIGKRGDELERYVDKCLEEDDAKAEREFRRQIDLYERDANNDHKEDERRIEEEMQRRQYEAKERDH